MIRALLFVVLAALAGPVLAATLYVSDDLSTTMRSGASQRSSIVETLESGTPVSVLKAHNGYTEVQAPDGKQGWVRTGVLQSTPVASDRLTNVQKQLGQAKKESGELQQKLKAATSTTSDQATAIDKLKQRNVALKQHLGHVTNAAAHSLQISRENDKLKARVAHLKQVRSQLEYQDRITESRREGIVIGAAILIGGIIVGLILPLLRLLRRRRSTWNGF